MAESDKAVWRVPHWKAPPSARQRQFTQRGDAPVDRRPLSAAESEIAAIEAAQRDVRAFAPLYETYVDLVWRYAMSRLADHERAADATSTTFQRAMTALAHFRPERRGDGTTFRSWLMTIARNVVIDSARAEHPMSSLHEPAVQRGLVDGQPLPEDHSIALEERRRVTRALSRLPETQRQIVELRLIGMKSSEIAGLLAMSLSAVKTAQFRAYARLRELLAEPEEDQGRSR